MGEWIHLTDSETGEPESSWIEAVGWTGESIILRRYEGDDVHVYKYEHENNDYLEKIFEHIKGKYNQGESIGSSVNSYLINNSEVPQAEKADI